MSSHLPNRRVRICLQTVLWPVFGAMSLTMLLAALRPAQAAPIPVTNTADDGPGSLRQAIVIAAAGDVITFDPSVSGAITLTTGELVINKDLTITGPGADVLAVSGNAASRVVSITAGVSVTVTGLMLRDGFTGGQDGAGIYNAGNLALFDSVVQGNIAPLVSPGSGTGGGIRTIGSLRLVNAKVISNTANGGGGIYNTGALVIVNSVVAGNSGGIGSGSGILNTGMLSVTSSSIRGNLAIDGVGGGVANTGIATVTASLIADNNNEDAGGVSNEGALWILNSTISGNRAAGGLRLGATRGGALAQTGSGSGVFSVIESSTIVSNTAVSNTFDTGVGLLIAGGSLTVGNNIVAFNNGADNFQIAISATVTNRGHNLSNGAIPGAIPTDRPNTDPRLGLLADNGGPTHTHALLPGSPAINSAGGAACPAADQRGVARPQAFVCDVGAYERVFISAWALPFIAK